ncbi:MAG TPA: hypothetical protein ENG60_03795 [Thermoplasmatales archaeon]|nr:hypothetical protein [Thermoplasmatales archaeon]HEX17511.1 hypothetical protein [Thermoplasmatales archaeon]
MLCGKERCPVLVRFYHYSKVKTLVDDVILDGSSPPSVFIGRIGYPKVAIGPLVPPYHGDTSYIDIPEIWDDVSIDDIIRFRSQLVRGKYIVNVKDVERSDRIIEFTRELALSKDPVDTEVLFEKKPHGRIAFYDDAQPHGPSAPIRYMDISNPKYDHRIEKAFYDTDMKAKDAIMELYKKGVMISRIQKAFSVGAFGEKKYRRFVPTRWSITAVDSIIGEELLKNTKTYPLINEYRVYKFKKLDNRWVIIFLPTTWRYELIEAWYPKTTWNPYGSKIAMFNSYEFYNGRKDYAEIGGCYYAARLAVNERLNQERRQAGVIVLREAHPGYILPVGVWNVREAVRSALKRGYKKCERLREVLEEVKGFLDIPVERWIKNSAILKDLLLQRRLEEFR